MFLVCDINESGYIHAAHVLDRFMVHRETCNMHLRVPVSETLNDAKEKMKRTKFHDMGELFVLELTSEGGGKAIWVTDKKRPEVEKRLTKFKTCYGKWELMRLNAA